MTPALASASGQIEPFSMKLDSGEEITVFTYRQEKTVSIALRVTGPGETQIFISAIQIPDTGTQLTVSTSAGLYKLRRPAGKAVAVYDNDEKVVGKDQKFLTGSADVFDRVETLRQLIATKVAASQNINVDAVGSQTLKELVVASKVFAAK
jgi:hypothetical protein